jgi:hypothetical protein
MKARTAKRAPTMLVQVLVVVRYMHLQIIVLVLRVLRSTTVLQVVLLLHCKHERPIKGEPIAMVEQ